MLIWGFLGRRQRKPQGGAAEDISFALINSGMFGTAVKKNEQLMSTLQMRATGMRKPSRSAPPPLPQPVEEIPEEESKPLPASHLHLAVQEGHINSVRFLLDQDDTDLFAVDSFGNTALHSALESGHEIMAALLIQV